METLGFMLSGPPEDDLGGMDVQNPELHISFWLKQLKASFKIIILKYF